MAFPRSLQFRLAACCRRISTFLLWLLLLIVRVDAQNGTDEVQTLLNFKASMGVTNMKVSFLQGKWVDVSNSGGDWSYWSTWKETDTTPCNWVGVVCTTNLTVRELQLSGWGLYQLTSESLEILSNLTELRTIDFSFNYLGTGFPYNIPETIQTLTGLERLYLAHNSFGGEIPANISACRNLKYISIEENQLTGNMQSLRGLAHLQVLLLTNNKFSGPFPEELGDISSLVNIDLSGNMLNGTIPSLPKLTNLLDLNLDGNNFTGFEGPFFPGVTSLEHLSVSGNQLQGTIPSGIGKLLNLKILDMSLNQLSGDIPAAVLQPELSTNYPISMNLSHNLLTGNIPFNGSKLCNYFVMDLSNNNLSGQIPFIYKTTKIYSLWLQNNLLSGDIVNFLGDSSGLASLLELRLGNNLLSGDLKGIASLKVRFYYLQAIDLSYNSIRMSATEAILNPLKAALDFFTTGGILTEFRVGGNDFTGIALPVNFGNYSTLEFLDCSNNHLQGEISSAAFNNTWLPSLQYLNLSNNDVTGPIPESLVMLPNLATLDLTKNNLVGQLPYIVPDSRLFSPNFYANNTGLCGDPLPPCPQRLRTGVQWWVWPIVVGCVITALGSFLFATWRWKVYHKRHQQDADLIKILLERESTTLMSLQELKKATDYFDENAQIGEGGFGTVYAGKLSDGTKVAIKRSKREGSEKDKQQFLNEVRILSKVNHQNLVKLLGCCMENKIALLVFEFISNGTLQEHLQGKVGVVCLGWKQRLLIAIQTAEALNYLHSATMFPIYHRDVKSANILLDQNLNAKVSDFGVSRLAPPQATHVSTIEIKGTMGYIDPEYYTSFQLTDKSDVYSFGVVLLELLSAKPPIDFLRGEEATSLVTFATPHIERGDLQPLIDPALLETYDNPTSYERQSMLEMGSLAVLCLTRQSRARPSMKEVCKELQNIWFELEEKSKLVHSTSEDDEGAFGASTRLPGHIYRFDCTFSVAIYCLLLPRVLPLLSAK